MSGMEAALKLRALPLSSGWGKSKPLIVMVVNGSPLANYQACVCMCVCVRACICVGWLAG